MTSSSFYMIVSSLPRIAKSFKVDQPPISRLQLEKRLKLLPEDKKALAYTIESLTWTSWFNPEQSIEATQKTYHDIMQTHCAFIQDFVNWFLDLRSLLAAMRMRSIKSALPENLENFLITRLEKRIIHHWHEPNFGLKSLYPWLPKIASDLAENNTSAVEEFLLVYIWKHLESIETGHYFDFEAIIIYLLRWNIIHYWSKFNNTESINSIDDLISTLVANNNLTAESPTTNKGAVL